MLDNTSNQPSKFRTRNWVEINDGSRGQYNVNSEIRFKTTMSSLCDYNNAYTLVKGTVIITGAGNNDGARQTDERNKGVIFINFAPFTDCVSEINNTQIDNAHYLDAVMLMYNLIEYSDNYSKASGSLWQYYRDKPDDNLTDSESFKSKIRITENNPADSNTKYIEIVVPLNYLSKFWRKLEMPLVQEHL